MGIQTILSDFNNNNNNKTLTQQVEVQSFRKTHKIASKDIILYLHKLASAIQELTSSVGEIECCL